MSRAVVIRAVGLDASDTLFHNARRAARAAELERAGYPGLGPRLRAAIATVGARDGWPVDVASRAERYEQWFSFLHLALREAGLGPDAARAAAGFAEDVVDPDSYRLFDDVLSTLDQLDGRGLPVALVSNFDPLLDDILDRLGLADRFATVVTSWEVGRYKPHPSLFRTALERLRLPAPAVLFAGDSPRADVGGARAAGLPAVLLDRTDEYPGFAGARISRLPDLFPLVATACTD